MDAVADQYNYLSEAIVSSVPQGWQKAWISADEVEKDTAEITGDYVDHSGQEHWFSIESSDLAYKAADAVMTLNKLMTIPGQKPWSKCKFTLFPDGTFKFDVEYDD
jgi:Protein of unknown function, DUF600